MIGSYNYSNTQRFNYNTGCTNNFQSCQKCPKRHNCLSYLIYLVEQGNFNENSNIISEDQIKNIIGQFSQEILEQIGFQIQELAKKDKEIKGELRELRQEHKEIQQDIDFILCQIKEDEDEDEIAEPEIKAEEIKINTELAMPKDIYQEKKNVFGKTKWVKGKSN